MNKIEVKQTSIVINDYEMGDSPKIEGIFSVYDMLTHSYFFKAIEYNENEKRLILPRGIDLFYIENIFNASARIAVGQHDKYDKINDIKIKYLPRDDEQREALKFMTGELQYKNNKGHSQLSVNLNTGKGKTYCSIATACYLKLRSAIITSSISWLEQWRDCILQYTDTKPREIYMMTGTASILRLLKKDISQYKFILMSHGTIKSYGNKYGWDKVTELFKYTNIGIKFYDEAHLEFDNICKIDFHTNTYKTFYVTATPSRSDKDENRIYQLYFKNVPAIDLFNENSDPHTKYIAIRYGSSPTAQEVTECKNVYGLDRNKYTNYVVKKDNFYKMLRIIIDMAMKVEGKVLLFIGTNNAIEIVKNWMVLNYPELSNDIGIFTSTVTKDKEKQLEKKIILSTTKSCGAAVDIKGLKMTVVLAEPFKSEIIARQTLGRTRDKNTMYIEIVDNDFYYVKKYYYEKKPIFNKYALDCTEIKIKQNELDIRSKNIIQAREKIMIQAQATNINDLYVPIVFTEGRLVEAINKINCNEYEAIRKL